MELKQNTKQEKRLISGSASFLLSFITYRENDGTGGGQKNRKLVLYYGEKLYLSKVVNGEKKLVLTGIDKRLCKVAYSVFFACADWLLYYVSGIFARPMKVRSFEEKYMQG